MLRAALVLVPWIAVSMVLGSMFHPLPRIDSVAPIIVGYAVALLGAYWVGRYVRCDTLFLICAGVCSILWTPNFNAFVHFMESQQRRAYDDAVYWIVYCVLAACFMLATRHVAQVGHRHNSRTPP